MSGGRFGQSDQPEPPQLRAIREGIQAGLERAPRFGLRAREVTELSGLQENLRDVGREFAAGVEALALVGEFLTPAELLRLDRGEQPVTKAEVRRVFDLMRIIFDGLVRK